jgi:UDP-N-acetylmuramoyl-tripeptide--D-alanyl-D-alanine ligase
MIHMSLDQAAAIIGIKNANFSREFTGLSIDTRTLQNDNLFIALPGEHVDGHDYIETAQNKGAAGAIVTRNANASLPQLQVNDVVEALGKLGATWRNQFSIPFIAVTGSNGKTTLKNMIASIMTAACHGNEAGVLATKGTLNNHLGLPLTLARLNKSHQFAVIEMGMNHFGEIEYLTKLTRPHVAVITNAAASHLEGVGDLAGVARAKAEIFLGLQPNGTAILNRDDNFFSYWREQVGQHNVLSFGFNKEADVSATLNEAGQTQQLTLRTPKGNIDIKLPLLGKHNVQNALAAAAATLALRIDLQTIKAGLEAMVPAPGRMQIHTLANGVKLIDDTYNANPFSLQAAVDALSGFEGKKIIVLGDMRELGSDSKSLHALAGEKIRSAGIHQLFTFGDLTASTSQAFGEGAHHFTEQNKLIDAIKPLLSQQMTVLVKGSRSMHMEKVVNGLLEKASI